MRVLITADTHVPDFARSLPRELLRAAERAEVILHAGDATSADVLAELAAFAPVHAAIGNIDSWDVAEWGARPEVEIELAGVHVSMIHDAGPREGRLRRLRRRFPDAGLVVFGHSHIPLDEEDGAFRIFNPGSPTWKRRAATATFAFGEFRNGTARLELVSL
jgi:putative phosphoesterase